MLDRVQSDDVKTKVKAYVLSEFLPGEIPEALEDDTPLVTGGILDSLASLKLVEYLEQEFGITTEAHEVSVESLDSINAIQAFVQRKLG